MIFGPESMVAKAVISRLHDQVQILTVGRTGAELSFDLANDEEVAPAGTYDAAIICTASFGGNDAQGMLLNANINALGSLRAAALSVQAGCRHITYLSSLSAIEHPDNGYFGSYGLSKKQGEENVRMLCRSYDVNCAILQITQIYDVTGQSRQHQPLLFHIIDQARAGKEITFFGRRDPVRNYLFCEDLAEMVVRLMKRGITGTYPCVAPVSLRLSEIASLAYRTFGTPEQIRFSANREDIPTINIPDGSELYALLGYRPETDLAHGFRLMQQELST